MTIQNTSRAADFTTGTHDGARLNTEFDNMIENDQDLQTQITTNLTAANTTASEVVAGRNGQASLLAEITLLEAIRTEVIAARSSATQGDSTTLDARLEAIDSRITNALSAAQGASEVVEARTDEVGTAHASVKLNINRGSKSLQGLSLAAISDSVVSSAALVDVFLYDTSKDSDGGAWRKKCQETSWYNETLNTATRGSTRPFPALALIVATTTAVAIYDLTDYTVPLWLSFASVGSTYPVISTPTGLFAMNGIVMVSTSAGGLVEVNFPKDRSYVRDSGALYAYKGSIGQRGSSLNFRSLGATGAIVASAANDVAAFVHPGNLIDVVTGLPIPTVAVATDGGVSVIKSDGTVYDMTTHASYDADSVAFDENGLVCWTMNLAAGGEGRRYVHAVPTADHAYSSNILEMYKQGSSDSPSVQIPGSGDDSTTFIPNAVGDPTNGLYLLKRNVKTPSSTMLNWIGSTFNTGWQIGAAKGAWLNSSTEEVLTGSDLVTNGDMSSATGWTVGANWSIAAGVATHTAGATADLSNAIGSLSSGTRYLITFTVAGRTAGSVTPYVGSGVGTAVSANGTYKQNILMSGSASIIFTPSSDFDGTIDNVSVRALSISDKSIAERGLAVVGSITKSAVATSASLMAYSGWSASNYIEQGYNSGLDFGSSDFIVYGWIKLASITASNESLLRRDDVDGNGGGAWRLRVSGTTGYFSAWISDDNGSTTDTVSSTASVADGLWHLCALVRSGSNIKAYVDGVHVATTSITAAAGSLNNSKASLRFGLTQAGAEPFNGSMALWRASTTIPTDDQMKFMFETEKQLFQEGAIAIIPSNDIRHLSNDSDSDALLVGTITGTARMSGCRRAELINSSSNALFTSNTIRATTGARDAYAIATGAEVVAVVPAANRREPELVAPRSPSYEVKTVASTDFANSWTNYGASNSQAAYHKDGAGRVWLQGLVASGTVNTAMFTLPPGYRPALTKRFMVVSNDAVGVLEVSNAGVVTLTVGNNTYASLDGISFLAER